MAEESLDLADPLDPNDVADVRQQQVLLHEDKVAQAQALLRDRTNAYKRFFNGKAQPGDYGLVIGDLRKFCRGGQTAWAADPREHALLTGRQEVYQRIWDHIELSFDDLWERYS